MEGFNAYTTAAWPAANRALFLPFEIANPILVRKIAWQNSSTVNGNIDVGIYDHHGNALVTLGGVAMAGASVFQAGDIADTILAQGYYFLAFASSSATATFVRMNSTPIVMQAAGCQQMDSAYPLPAVATFANPVSAYHHLVWLNGSPVAI